MHNCCGISERASIEQRGPLIGCPEWLPETQPSFPLPATNSVTLMLAMLITLYGLDYSQYVDATSCGHRAIPARCDDGCQAQEMMRETSGIR